MAFPWMEVIVMGTVGVGAWYLFFTKDGKQLLESITGGGVDPFADLRKRMEEARESVASGEEAIVEKYKGEVAKGGAAFIPGSQEWYDVVARDRGKAVADELMGKIKQEYMYAYY